VALVAVIACTVLLFVGRWLWKNRRRGGAG